MFKFEDLTPAMNAMMAEKQAEQEAHERDCTAEVCERCCKVKPIPEAERLAAGRAAFARPVEESIPAAFAQATFDAEWLRRLVGARAVADAMQALGAARVAFIGPPGSGKTSLAIAMLRAAVAAEPASTWRTSGARYVSAHRLAKARAMHPLGDGEAPLVSTALRAPLLVLDELGGEDTRYASAVAEVIYERHADDLPTWVTTGVTPERLAERYGGGIARRLFEGAQVFRLTGRK